MNRTTKLVLAAGAAVAVASAQGALTAGNTIASSTAGYGTSTISGATATSVTYGLSADGTQINSATVVLSGDMTGRTVKAGFGTDALTACTLAAYVTGTPGSTTATCSGYSAVTASSTAFNVAVS